MAGDRPAALGRPGGGALDGLAVSGRPQPDASIDDVPISAGRWWTGPGEVVLGRETAEMFGLQVGRRSPCTRRPVAGGSRCAGSRCAGGGRRPEAHPTDEGGGGRTDPGHEPHRRRHRAVGQHAGRRGLDEPRRPGGNRSGRQRPPGRCSTASSRRPRPRTSRRRSRPSPRACPPTPSTSTYTYLETKVDVDSTASLYVPILLAFSAFALAAAAFTIANIVSGIVLTSYRDIGVMKAIGFTPLQVTSILLAQILVPATIGDRRRRRRRVARQQLRPSSAWRVRSGSPATFSLSIQVVAVVALFAIGVSFVAAVLPAIGAGRLSAVRAISSGTSPSGRPDGGRLRRLGLRLPAGIATRLGVAAGLAHPVRATMTLGALLVGVAAVTFSVGVNASLVRAIAQIDRSASSPVRAEVVDASADAEATTEAIAARSGHRARRRPRWWRRSRCRGSDRSRSSATTATRAGSASS